MKQIATQTSTKNFYLKVIYYSIATLLICVFQLSVSFLISISGVTPDLLILLVIWVTLAEGKVAGLFFAFVVGLFFDYLSMNVLGVNALSKTIAAYVVGFYYKENEFWNILKSNKIFVISAIAILLHNLFYYLFMINLTGTNLWSIFFKHFIASSLYSFAFTGLSFFLRVRKFW